MIKLKVKKRTENETINHLIKNQEKVVLHLCHIW